MKALPPPLKHLACIAVFAAAFFAGQALAAPSSTICNWGGAQDFEVGFITCGTGQSYDIRVYDALTGVLVSETLGVNENTNIVGAYDWVAHFNEGVEPPRVDLNSNTLYRISFGSAGSYLYYNCSSSRPGYVAGSFTCPFSGSDPTPDVIFSRDELGTRVAPINIPGHEGISSYLGGQWIFPHYLDEICDNITCPAGFEDRFSMFISTSSDTEHELPAFDMTVPTGESWMWDGPEVTKLKFANRTQLIAEGSLAMDGITLTEMNTGDGWYGVRYEPNSGGYIRGSTIEKFAHVIGGGPGLLAPFVCGLTVNDRWLAVYRSTIRDGFNGAYGVCSYGSQGQVALRDEIDPNTQELLPTAVIGNNGHGLYAYSQGRIFLRGSDVTGNDLNGGLALGTQARIYANEGSSISGNLGVGLEARSDGNIYLYNPNTPSAPTGTIIDGNIGGGLLAQFQGSYINAGTFLYGGGLQGTCQAACENFITGHDAAGIPYDVKAASGSFVTAEFDHWGFGRTQESDLVLDEDATSMIDVLPIWDGISALREGPVALKSGSEPSAFGDNVRRFIGEAFDKAAEGRWIPAFAKAQAALALAFSEDDLQLVMGAVSVLVSQPDAPDLPIGLLTAIEAHLGAGREARPFALRTLLTADRVRGRDAEGRATAQTLIADYPRTEHALTALAQEVSFALETDDLSAAQTALATMEGDFPDEVLTTAARAYFVLLAGEEALPARSASTPAVVASTGASSEASVSDFTLHAAYPNPFNPQTVVPFSVNESANVSLRVLDMLGRQVATLADGRYEAGLYNAVFDGSQLSSGIYLLRAEVTPENGGASRAFTQRLTLLK